MIKLAAFRDHEEICMTPNGSYCTCTWAIQQAEEFINKPNIKVIDIKYANNDGHTSILIVYKNKIKGKRVSR